MKKDEYVEHPQFSDMQVVSILAQSPTASRYRRHYLEDDAVEHIESSSILDLFSHLNRLPQDVENTWLIVDHSGDTEALLKEIRQRYSGNLAVYGYQFLIYTTRMSIAHDHYTNRSVRSALIQLLSNQPLFEREKMESFNGQGLHILAVDDHLPNLIVL